MIGNVFAVIIGYLLGAIPLGLLLARVLKGIDVRDYGSGKIGATNVMRTLGFKAALLVAAFDMGKGTAAVFIARGLGDSHTVEALAAIAAVAGHNWSLFIRFSGGRGVSTSLGGLFALTPVWASATLGVGIFMVAATRYVSLGSLAGALFSFGATLGLAVSGHQRWQYFAYTAVAVAFILIQHHDNILRLFRGTERRLGQKAGPSRRARKRLVPISPLTRRPGTPGARGEGDG